MLEHVPPMLALVYRNYFAELH